MRNRALLTAGIMLVLTMEALGSEARRLTIGLNFTGSTSSVDSFFIPPDTLGAVGVSHIVELINGRYSVYRKSDGVRLQTSSLDQFWINAGASPSGFTADSRLLYDPFSQRWFASTGDFNFNPGGGDHLLFAVSKSSDPTSGWKGFTIPFSGPVGTFIDFPTLGSNRDGVYLYSNGAVVVLPKNDLLAAVPTIAHATVLKSTGLLTPTGSKLQPVVDLDNAGLPEALMAEFDIPGTEFRRSNITGAAASPVLDTSDGFISVTPFAGLGNVGAEQPDSAVTISTGSLDFVSSVILRNGVIWGVHTIANERRAALRWFAIDASTNAVLQEGLIADPNQDVYMGSIAVNEFNDVVIGFNESSATQFASSYAVLGTTTGGVTTFGTPLLLRAGVSRYELTGGAITARWGDYSATVVDPTDPFTFWTFQEWVSAENTWATQITQLKVINGETAPPVITVSASAATLCPPNGKMIPVTVAGTITSGSGVNASTAAYAVTDEYGLVQPSGRVTLGPNGSYSFTIQLQASRNGNDKDGRHYTVAVSAQDSAGKKGTAATSVTVPRDLAH